MSAALIQSREAGRPRALDNYGVLDTPPEDAFDELAALAARICDAPISLISLIDRERLWFKSHHGLALTETPLAMSFCAHALIHPTELLIVPDAARDPRFADNPLVTGEPCIRFYAGVPFCTPEGEAIGALCVIDRIPRDLSPSQQDALRVLGRQVGAQLELRRSMNETILEHARLENSQRIAGLGDWEYDVVNDRLFWSEEIYRILGISRKDSPPRPETFYRQVHPDDLALVHREKEAAAAGSGRASFEHRIVRPDGEVRFVRNIAEIVADIEGRPVRETGAIQDITEQKRSETSLKQSEERYRLMFEQNPSPMWVFDQATLAFLAVNGAALALYGYSHGELLAMTVREIRRPEEVPDFLKRMALSSSEPRSAGRFLHRKKDGTIFPVAIFAHVIAFAGRAAQLVLAVDMTESEHASAALAESETRFRALSESSPLGIFEGDADGRVVYCNPALVALVGRPVENILGQGWEENLHPDDRAVTVAGWARAAADGKPWDLEKRLLRPDGSMRLVHTLVAPSKDGEGRIIGFVGTVEDITERKQAEAALRSSEERYRTMLQGVEAGVIVHGPDTRITAFNEKASELLGVTEAQMTARLPHDAQWSRLRADGLPFPDAELPYRNAHASRRPVRNAIIGVNRPARGDFIWLSVSANPVLTAEGTIAEVIVTAMDVTARIQAEHALGAERSLMRRLIDNIPDLIYAKDCEGRYLLANEAVAKMLGLKNPGELLGKTDRDFFPEKIAAGFMAVERSIFAGQLAIDREETTSMKEGQRRFFVSTKLPLHDQDGKIIGLVGFGHEITEQKRKDEVVTSLAAIVENSVDAIISQTLGGVITSWNPAAEQMFGYTASEIIGQPLQVLIPPDRPEEEVEILAGLARGNSVRHIESIRVRKNGQRFEVSETISPTKSPDGRIVGVSKIVRDITELKRLEEQIRQSQKMEAVGTLAGGIAHDFNNILASICGFAELAKMTLAENPEAREYLDSVLVAGQRATDLVSQILTFSRQQPLKRRPIQLLPIVAETLKLLRATIPSTVEFDVSLATDAPVVFADPTQIHQILMNLATNAWHAMNDSPGRLQVSLERCVIDPADAVAQSRLRPGVYARVSVSDTGCGMDPATLRRVFEPFFTTKPTGKGTGLGLAVVQGIMDNHDGAVTVFSQPGQGTVFHLHFPAYTAEPTLALAEAEPVPRGHGERVLIVDDEDLLVQLGKKTLAALGYAVEGTTQATAALAMLRADPQRFDLVITDQTMPGMTGLVLASQLRQIRPGLPIILTTGYSLSLTSERLEAAGIRQLLLKPNTLHSLGVAAHAALQEQSPN